MEGRNRNIKMKKASKAPRPVLVPNPKARLLDQVREVMRFHHYAIRTEKTYMQWIRRFLVFHREKIKTGNLSHVAALLCHTSAGKRLRHPHGSGTSWAFTP
jgi:hypothetical protein